MVRLEDLDPARYELVARWLSAPSVNRWLTSNWRGREVTPATIAMAVRNRRNRLFLVVGEGIPVGLVSLAELDPIDRSAEIWYALDPDAAGGKGITTQAVRLLVNHAFDDLGLMAVFLNIMSTNTPSIRVAEKVGFRPAGRVRQAMTCDGESVDRLLFDLVPDDLRAPVGPEDQIARSKRPREEPPR